MFRRKNRKLPKWRKVLVPEFSSSAAGSRTNPATSVRRRVISIIKFGVLVLVIYGFAAGPAGSVRLIKLYRDRQKLQAETRRITAEVVQLENIRRYLETDMSYIEQVAREDYGLSRPNETIYLDAQAGQPR